MPHFFSFDSQKSIKCNFGCFLFFTFIICLLLVSTPLLAAEQEEGAPGKSTVNGLSAKPVGENLEITIHCSGQPRFTTLELTRPPRLVVEIVDAEIQNQSNLALPEAFKIEVISKSLQDTAPELIRIVFTLPRMYPFKSEPKENDIVITVEGFYKDGEQVAPKEEKKTPEPDLGELDTPESADTQLEAKESSRQDSIDIPKIDPLNAVSDNSDEGGAGTDAAPQVSPLGTIENELISVDFYKIDLHNVFRMLREISGKNIVVAGGVSGNLTLALTDVPWEFALDIILNLKDLKKMGRDNTIVIYPKDKEFIWPEKEDKGLSIEEDEEITRSEAIIIKQEQNIPPARLEAKKLIANGRTAEKKGDLENAAQLYEKALSQWPENSKLANKIAAIYLAKLNQNAKAVYFAKKALAADKKNSSAALNAAIGHANMEENRQAQQYFDQSVNSGKPSPEALISYAAFSERQQQHDAALRLLDKFDELYGKNLNSMVSRARILDKQGNQGAANKIYKAILYSGFRVPPDLKKFILNKIRGGQFR